MGFLGKKNSGAGGGGNRRSDGDEEDGTAGQAGRESNANGEPGADAQAAMNAEVPGGRGSLPMGSSGDTMETGSDAEEAGGSRVWGSFVEGFGGSGGGCGVGLPDVDAMKEQVRKNLLRPSYDVRDFYKTEGAFQAIARAQWFENATLAVIAMNALWIWIDTDYNNAEMLIMAHPIFQFAEHFFCIYFSLEWTIRFASFRKKRNGLRDAWFVFDSALVLMMVLETWVMTAVILAVGGGSGGGALGNASILRMARLLRLSRMARMVRLFRAMPELLILIKGMVAATRSVFFTLCLLLILLYVFGIAFRQLMEGSAVGEEHFNTVLASMYTLLIDGTFMDNLGTVVRDVGQESPVCAALMWVFVLLSSLTVMNMLIGVLCEVVSAVAATEKETLVVSFVREKMSTLFEHLDASGDGLISKEEFLGILKKPEASRLLEEVGVDVVGLVDQADAIFMESDDVGEFDKELSFPDLMEVILELRGTNTAKVKNIVELRKTLMTSVSQIHKSIAGLEEKFEEIQGIPHNQRAASRRMTVRRGSKQPSSSMGKTNSPPGEGKEASGAPLANRRFGRAATCAVANFDSELSKTSTGPGAQKSLTSEDVPTFVASDGELYTGPAKVPLHSAASPRSPDSSHHGSSPHHGHSGPHVGQRGSHHSGQHGGHHGGSQHNYHHSHSLHSSHHGHHNYHNHHANHSSHRGHSSHHNGSHGGGFGATIPHPGAGLGIGTCSSPSVGGGGNNPLLSALSPSSAMAPSAGGDDFGAHVAAATASVVKEVGKEVAALVAQLQRAVAAAKGDIEREALLSVAPSEGPPLADGQAVAVGGVTDSSACALGLGLGGGAAAEAAPAIHLPGALDDESPDVGSTCRLVVTGPEAEVGDTKALSTVFAQPGALSGPPPTTLAPTCVFNAACEDKASTASVSGATASGRGGGLSSSSTASASAAAGGECGGTGAVSAEGSSDDLSLKLASALAAAAPPLDAGTDEGPRRRHPRFAGFEPVLPDPLPLAAAKKLFFATSPDSLLGLEAGGGALPAVDLEDIRSHLSSLLEAVKTVTQLQKIRERVTPLRSSLSGGAGGGGGNGGGGGGGIGAAGAAAGGGAAPEAPPATNPQSLAEVPLLSLASPPPPTAEEMAAAEAAA